MITSAVAGIPGLKARETLIALFKSRIGFKAVWNLCQKMRGHKLKVHRGNHRRNQLFRFVFGRLRAGYQVFWSELAFGL